MSLDAAGTRWDLVKTNYNESGRRNSLMVVAGLIVAIGVIILSCVYLWLTEDEEDPGDFFPFE